LQDLSLNKIQDWLKLMTLKNTIKTSIALLAITITIAITTPTAEAHPSPTLMTLDPFDKSDGTQEIWYDMNSLAYVTLDGQSNNVGLRLIGEVSRTALDITDMDVTETSTYGSGDSRFDAAYIGDALTFGYTPNYGSGTSMYKVIYLNTNDNLDYDTSAGCTGWWDLVNPQNIANHEFGHYAGLSHHGWTWSSTHTAMEPGCNVGQSSLRADDKTDINNWYN